MSQILDPLYWPGVSTAVGVDLRYLIVSKGSLSRISLLFRIIIDLIDCACRPTARVLAYSRWLPIATGLIVAWMFAKAVRINPRSEPHAAPSGICHEATRQQITAHSRAGWCSNAWWWMVSRIWYCDNELYSLAVTSSQKEGGNYLPLLNFRLSENVLVGKLSSKTTTSGAENPPFWGI